MKTKTEEFIDKIKLKNNPNHFNKDGSLRYDYSKTIYIKSKQKVIIVCLEHGDFEQEPNSHLKGVGCKKCVVKGSYTKIDFISKANLKHHNKYSYEKTIYNHSHDKVIITCPIHGDFEQRASNHIIGKGCYECCIKVGVNKRKTKYTLENFINKAKLKHKDFYSYNKSYYKNSVEKVIITCPIHGDFEQAPSNHLKGQGCPKCSIINSGYTATAFKERCIKNNKGLGILYVIRCFNESESFYKVGITSTDVKTRYNKSMPYDYEIIHEVHREPNKVYDMENYLLRALAKNSYKPLIPFTGQTECFTDIEALYKIFKDKLAA